ncbi:MAG TPA: hypothetical protein VEN81_17290 [Planctomycetota bacterium]|nr:hypothetical protein [Planctomycetota bacterium]
MKTWAALLVVSSGLSSCSPPDVPERTPRLSWEKNILSVRGEDIPGGRIEILYLEAYCRSKSTHRAWGQTTLGHRTEKTHEAPDGSSLRLHCSVAGGVEVEHTITAGPGEVDFRVEAVNRGGEYVDAVWVQPCIRVGEFTGGDQKTYVERCFIFVDGQETFLPQVRSTEEALYKGGQVYVPRGIDREDVNPRPLSPEVPSNGLIGCISSDGSRLFATAWEPYQELFQGVFRCIHSDFRLGGLKPGETKRAHGKIYLMANDVDRLLRRYQRDFPEAR